MHACSKTRRCLWGVAVAIAALACGKARPVVDSVPACTDWNTDVGPLAAANCASCHSGSMPAGQYDLTTYLGALGDGSNSTPNAIAGDPTSRVLTTIAPGQADSTHAPFTNLYSTFYSWVVTCDLDVFNSLVHRGGILNPASPDFHGTLLQGLSWNFGVCAECHGSDFSGGPAQTSCLTCHSQGVTACATCHGGVSYFKNTAYSGPFGQSGAHSVHYNGGLLRRQLDCSECHVKPAAYTDPGHLFDAQGNVITSPAPVVFGTLANASLPGKPRSGPPTWDASTQTCTNIYCHGATFGDTTVANPSPTWSTGAGPATCTTCHGQPPSDHALSQCNLCHSQIVDAQNNLINPALHLVGAVSLGDGSGTCSACHGSTMSPAPPKDLEGDTATTAVGVGAHTSHLFATHKLSAPVPCAACHLVPSTVTSPGHIDHPLPATVFPNSPEFMSIATDDNADAAWSHSAATCNNVYCHGGGQHLSADTSATNQKPVWTSVGTGEAACGACHGIPPNDGTPGHTANAPLYTCVNCHAKTVDASGAIIVTTTDGGQGTSYHINGMVDGN
jgi:predicted CxxxxCH...CXXCH cytochrome family protein